MQPGEQLLLNHVRPRPDARLTDFAGDSYAGLVSAGQDLLRQPSGLLYVHGRQGSGRSHFLSALCTEAETAGLRSVLVPLAALDGASAGILDGLEGSDLLALDDIQVIAGCREWEEALFHCFNRCRSVGVRLAFSADNAPAGLGLVLPDLVSRLGQAPCWAMGLPDDQSREQLIQAAAHRRGWILEADVLRYLVVRAPREPDALLACLERLDQLSLRAARRLTIPFVRECLERPEPDRGVAP